MVLVILKMLELFYHVQYIHIHLDHLYQFVRFLNDKLYQYYEIQFYLFHNLILFYYVTILFVYLVDLIHIQINIYLVIQLLFDLLVYVQNKLEFLQQVIFQLLLHHQLDMLLNQHLHFVHH